jgi:hypothetical protein
MFTKCVRFLVLSQLWSRINKYIESEVFMEVKVHGLLLPEDGSSMFIQHLLGHNTVTQTM